MIYFILLFLLSFFFKYKLIFYFSRYLLRLLYCFYPFYLFFVLVMIVSSFSSSESLSCTLTLAASQISNPTLSIKVLIIPFYCHICLNSSLSLSSSNILWTRLYVSFTTSNCLLIHSFSNSEGLYFIHTVFSFRYPFLFS